MSGEIQKSSQVDRWIAIGTWVGVVLIALSTLFTWLEYTKPQVSTPEQKSLPSIANEVPPSISEVPLPSSGSINSSPPIVNAPPIESRPPSEQPATSNVENKEIISARLFDAISIENLDNPEKSDILFPFDYFHSRLSDELGSTSSSIGHIRVAVAFIEPRVSRPFSMGGKLIGYILVSLPDVAPCTRKFGDQVYDYPQASTGMMKAVNEQARHIALWIQSAARGGDLKCPNN